MPIIGRNGPRAEPNQTRPTAATQPRPIARPLRRGCAREEIVAPRRPLDRSKLEPLTAPDGRPREVARIAQLAERVLKADDGSMGDLTDRDLPHFGAFTRHFGRAHPADFPDRILGAFVAHAAGDEAVQVAAESRRAHHLDRPGPNPAASPATRSTHGAAGRSNCRQTFCPACAMASSTGASVMARTPAGSGQPSRSPGNRPRGPRLQGNPSPAALTAHPPGGPRSSPAPSTAPETPPQFHRATRFRTASAPRGRSSAPPNRGRAT